MSRLTCLVALVACSSADRDREGPVAGSAVTAPAAKTVDAPAEFGLYVLALTWAPSFCCGHPDKAECADLTAAFAGTHLTLHGLWPNYTDAEAKGRVTYPQFCGAYEHCKKSHDASCDPDPSTIPEEMRTLGPGYLGDHDFLADHEWPRHGSCTGLAPAAYFRAALGAMKAIPGEGTPEVMRTAIGGDMAIADLEGAFGVPAESVLLGCDASCRLSQVGFCLAHDRDGTAGHAVACPRNTTNAQYDNGCVTRGCARVAIPAAGSCAAAKPPKRPPPKGRACDHPGQGPACTANDVCVAAGFKRCARSGCCTSQP